MRMKVLAAVAAVGLLAGCAQTIDPVGVWPEKPLVGADLSPYVACIPQEWVAVVHKGPFYNHCTLYAAKDLTPAQADAACSTSFKQSEWFPDPKHDFGDFAVRPEGECKYLQALPLIPGTLMSSPPRSL